MKSFSLVAKTTWIVGMVVINSFLTGCQSDIEQDKELVRNQWATPNGKPIINHGRVSIKVEPFGSIQATVFQGQVPAYSFSIDREKPQRWLTGDIHKATTYLTSVGAFRDGLVIDDEQTHRRYVLSFYDISDRLKDLPTSKGQTVFIKGYSTGLERLAPSMASNGH
jgi:hypothetical protein